MASPITAPSGFQQESLIKHIFEIYGVDKKRIRVIEAHGSLILVASSFEI
jgi:acyl transferase domain-containing protein